MSVSRNSRPLTTRRADMDCAFKEGTISRVPLRLHHERAVWPPSISGGLLSQELLRVRCDASYLPMSNVVARPASAKCTALYETGLAHSRRSSKELAEKFSSGQQRAVLSLLDSRFRLAAECFMWLFRSSGIRLPDEARNLARAFAIGKHTRPTSFQRARSNPLLQLRVGIMASRSASNVLRLSHTVGSASGIGQFMRATLSERSALANSITSRLWQKGANSG